MTEWEATLPTLPLAEVAQDPARVALIAIDVTNGFCHEGPLASPRVKTIIAPIVRLMESAYRAGVRQFVLPQDTHEPDAVELVRFNLTQAGFEALTAADGAEALSKARSLLPSLVVLDLVIASLSAFHGAAFDTSYAMLVPEAQLPRANGMMQTIWGLSFVLAPAIAATLVSVPGLARQGFVPGAAGVVESARTVGNLAGGFGSIAAAIAAGNSGGFVGNGV